jgi:hypothetical protein
MDDMLTQLFRDKPIDQESLGKLRMGVMDQILAAPLDFQERISIAQRRKWGYVFLGILSTFSLSFFLLTWFAGPWLQKGLSQLSTWIVTYVPVLGVFANGWEWLVEKWILLTHLRIGLELLWNQYAFSIMGILLVWVLFDGMRDKLILREQK